MITVIVIVAYITIGILLTRIVVKGLADGRAEISPMLLGIHAVLWPLLVLVMLITLIGSLAKKRRKNVDRR